MAEETAAETAQAAPKAEGGRVVAPVEATAEAVASSAGPVAEEAARVPADTAAGVGLASMGES
jgi:hypothetical protein